MKFYCLWRKTVSNVDNINTDSREKCHKKSHYNLYLDREMEWLKNSIASFQVTRVNLQVGSKFRQNSCHIFFNVLWFSFDVSWFQTYRWLICFYWFHDLFIPHWQKRHKKTTPTNTLKVDAGKKNITNQRSHDKWLSTTKQAKNCPRLKNLRAHHDIWKCNVQRWKTLFPVEFCQFRHWFELHEKIKLKYLRILANEQNTLCCQYGRI